MTFITENNWTLHYTIGRILAAKVRPGDVVYMPGGARDLVVLGGRAPTRANDSGCVTVRHLDSADSDGFEVRPTTLGVVWISAAGGWSELPA